ncbi:MAG: 30S ribosome-binding factor RbfA [Acidobacteriaceae bacterium]|jgi:ribosome-binding factor A|nr:30S ribosome-binding factor RbfA [Acidobacteriaceae bacterium]
MEPQIRAQRISEALRTELAEMISFELADPRVDGVLVNEVHVSPDLKKARVLVAIPAGADPATVLGALNGARAFLRTQVAERLQLRRTPDLQFESGADVDPAKVKSLLRRIQRGRPRELE